MFAAEEEVPPLAFSFKGARGSIRVTMEVEGISNAASPVPSSLNDVLFQAKGDGRISFAFKRPSPELPHGRVTIRCVSGSEESSADFEPELWFHHTSGIVTYESPMNEPSIPVVEGKEVVLARYVARNIPRDLRLTFKALFSKNPVEPRTKAGVKPPR